jgi:lysophospholipase L1-like esterase
LVASLFLNALIVLGGLFFVVRKGGLPYLRGKYYEIVHQEQYGRTAYEPWGGPGFQRDTSVYRLAPIQPGDVVFLGDSHARGAWWSEVFGIPRVKNRGIDGDVTGGVLRRLDEVVSGRPSAVFLFIGSNDVDRGLGGATVEQTLASVASIVERIREGSPGTAVYLLSAPPKSSRSTLNATETPLAWQLNEGFARVASETGATYLDVSTPMRASDGSLQVDMTYDGSHLNAEGYRRVIEVVRPHVERHLATIS